MYKMLRDKLLYFKSLNVYRKELGFWSVCCSIRFCRWDLPHFYPGGNFVRLKYPPYLSRICFFQ